MAKALKSIGSDFVQYAKPNLKTFWFYAKVEMAPPKLSEIPQIFSGCSQLLKSVKTGAWKNLTVKQAFLNVLVATEVGCWFYVGECIGKMHLIGYKLS